MVPKTRRFCSAWVAALALFIPHCLFAVDESYSGVLKYLSPRPSQAISMKWIVGIAVAVILLLTLVSRLSGRKNRRHPHTPLASASQPKSQRNFLYQARTLGLRLKEGRNLKKIAAHLSPRQPESLLTTSSGRELLVVDIKKRIHRRRLEIEVLQQLQEKLERMNSTALHERESVRVETDLPVWITRKVQYRGSLPEGKEVFPEAEPIHGQLIDLGEGGAALNTELEIGEGDLVEIWSADPEIWIPNVAAGVVRVEPSNGDTSPVLHLHFLDPPAPELRAALRKLQVAQ
jgi:hypothetical protein